MRCPSHRARDLPRDRRSRGDFRIHEIGLRLRRAEAAEEIAVIRAEHNLALPHERHGAALADRAVGRRHQRAINESTRAPLARSPFPNGEGYDT